jgi:ketosteroid isomerase-like protein
VTREEIARAAFEAMAQRDWDELSKWLDPEVEWRNPEYAVEPGIRRGRDEFQRAVEAVGGEVGGAFDLTRVEAEAFEEVGEHVVMSFWLRGKGSGSGIPIDRRFGGLYGIRGGKVVSYKWFRNPEEAFAAARGETKPT